MKKILLFFIAATLFFTSGCINCYTYKNSKEYKVYTNDVEIGAFETLDIDWISGSVTIKYGDEFAITETSERELNDKNKLYYLFKNDKLSIKYCKSGIRTKGNLSKALVITLPYELSNLKVEAISANVTIEGITTNALNLDTVSGEVKLNNINANILSADTVSGNLDAININSNNITIDTTSGDVKMSAANIKNLSAESTSGDISVMANTINDVEVETTSGSVSINADIAEMSIDTVSGDVDLVLSSSRAFKMHYDTSSGSLSSKGIDVNGEYLVYLDGSLIYEVETVSGDLTVKVE